MLLYEVVNQQPVRAAAAGKGDNGGAGKATAASGKSPAAKQPLLKRARRGAAVN
jgi:hypothetical protein